MGHYSASNDWKQDIQPEQYTSMVIPRGGLKWYYCYLWTSTDVNWSSSDKYKHNLRFKKFSYQEDISASGKTSLRHSTHDYCFGQFQCQVSEPELVTDTSINAQFGFERFRNVSFVNTLISYNIIEPFTWPLSKRVSVLWHWIFFSFVLSHHWN